MQLKDALMTRKTEKKVREGQWLSDAMDKAGVDNPGLTEMLALNTLNLVSQWRNGHTPMSDLQMLKAAKALGASPYEIRPSLLEYKDVLSDEPLLAGISDDLTQECVRFIAIMRKQSEGARRGSTSPIGASKPRKPKLP
jgi:hypothetical protein